MTEIISRVIPIITVMFSSASYCQVRNRQQILLFLFYWLGIFFHKCFRLESPALPLQTQVPISLQTQTWIYNGSKGRSSSFVTGGMEWHIGTFHNSETGRTAEMYRTLWV